jgi:hypothetical protein
MAHRRFHVRGVLAAVLLAAWVTATVVAAGEPGNLVTTVVEPDWVFECAACPHNFYDLAPRTAQIGPDGVLHVVYGGEALYHAWQSSDDWQVEIVDDRLQVGSQASLVIAGDGTLHVFYLDEEAQSLRYTTGTSGTWVVETVAANISDEPWPSPAITADGQLYVAFRDGIQSKITLATRSGSSWNYSTVDSTGGHHPSLALDSSGRPHLSYVMSVPGELRYAYEDAGWQIETVHSDVRALQTGLAIDATGRAHLAYSGPPDTDWWEVLMYAYRDPAGWHHEVADGGEDDAYVTLNIGSDISLDLDAGGQPRVAYTSFHSSTTPYPWRFYSLPRYAMRMSDGWSISLLSEYGHTEGAAFTLDSAGQAHIVYQQVGDLVHSFYAGTWEREVVALGGVAGVGASMDLDANGRPRLSSVSNSVDSYFDSLLYTYRTVEGWQSERAGDTTLPHTELAVSPDGCPHLLYNTYMRFTHEYMALAYAYRDDGGWNRDLFWGEYPGKVGAFYDIAMAGAGQVHIVWVEADWTGGSLYYKSLHTPESLERELISDAGVRHVSLATDGGGNPHVAYSAGGALYYAYRDSAGWHEEIVSSSGLGVDQVALALDGNGQPHFAFYAAYSRDLYYLSRSLIDYSWPVGPVDAAGDVGQYPAIAVTGDGRPHISYYDATNQDLKYAHYDGDGWTWAIETLAREGNVGLYTSIDLYVYPHISYYDATRGDLMYVYKPFIPVAFSYLPLVAR